MYWDIESLENVFCMALYFERVKQLHIFYQVDGRFLKSEQALTMLNTSALDLNDEHYNQMLRNDMIHAIMRHNGNIKLRNNDPDKDIYFHDLHSIEANRLLIAYLGGCSSIAQQIPGYIPFINDYDTNYDEENIVSPYVMGYNSYNYDTTMYALYIMERFRPIQQMYSVQYVFDPNDECLASTLRKHNNELFTDRYKSNMPSYLRGKDYPDGIRREMLHSGRHIDVARLNEKQAHVGLKRICGMLGFQILESKKLKQGHDTIETWEELLELFAYNTSDVLQTGELFNDKLYTSNFMLKRQLLKDYPELIYNKAADKYAPDIRPDNVRRDRLCIDSSSSTIASYSLCPYGHLNDIEGVSFMYPSEAKAKARGIERIDVLEEANKFFLSHFPVNSYPYMQWKEIYDFYSSIRGKNFNDSTTYMERWGVHPVESAKDYKPHPIPYFNKDGSPSSCYANFSTGGIHGAEYNKALYDHDVAVMREKMTAMVNFKNAADHVLFGAGSEGLGRMPTADEEITWLYKNGCTEYTDPETKKLYKLKDYTSKSTKTKEYKWKPIKPVKLFSDEGKINAKYVYTSAGECEHEDFTSYYPNLLINLDAFYNEGLGYDRYEEIFGLKQDYGHKMKDKEHYDEKQRDIFSIMRGGTKLILNSASGKADAAFDNPIRMNNMIMSMRLIGQLFTWRIAQAQTLEGALITSTNTDGLYAQVTRDMFKHNEEVLARESDIIHVEIEPEPMVLVSKDTNNRAEFDEDFNISTASGGTLACYKNPNPEKSLAHPALVDYTLLHCIQHMIQNGIPFTEKLDKTVARQIITEALAEDDTTHVLKMAQNIFASSNSSYAYIFAFDGTGSAAMTEEEGYQNCELLDYYTRGFYVKDGTDNAHHIACANGRTVPDRTLQKRIESGQVTTLTDPLAAKILKEAGAYDEVRALGNRDMIIKKVSNVEDKDNVLIENHSLYLMDELDRKQLIRSLDIDKYVSLTESAYDNWHNEKAPDDATYAVSDVQKA